MQLVSRRTLAICVLLLGASISLVAASGIPCADYVTSSIRDRPMEGFLIGTETRTKTVSSTTKIAPGGVGLEVTGSTTVTYEVGTYDFGDTRIELDCSDYSQA